MTIIKKYKEKKEERKKDKRKKNRKKTEKEKEKRNLTEYAKWEKHCCDKSVSFQE